MPLDHIAPYLYRNDDSFVFIGERFMRASFFLALPFLALVSGCGGQGGSSAKHIPVTTTIQAAVDLAEPGDIVDVPAGNYPENVRVSKDNITIVGAPDAVLDGTTSILGQGILVRSLTAGVYIRGFKLQGLSVKNYPQNGIRLVRVDGFQISGGTYANNGEYGIFPIRSFHGIIDHNTVTGAEDAGIYVGQDDHIVVQSNHASECVMGIEIENCTSVTVDSNICSNNQIGIEIEVLPGLSQTTTSKVLVTNNTADSNNAPNPISDPDDILSFFPSGIGIEVWGADNVKVAHNHSQNNNTAGIVVRRLPPVLSDLDPNVEPMPDSVLVTENTLHGNGGSPDAKLSPPPGADLLWDGTGTGNVWVSNHYNTSFPLNLSTH